ncbi:hypothetical protein QF012_004750 [Pseudomonas laurylsulfatiphila]
MSLSPMQVFNDHIMPATLETLDQMIQAFNEASNGAIVLSPDGFTGDLQESFFQNLGAAQRRVDRYDANATVTPVDLTELQNYTVKVAGGFGPLRYEPSQMTWLSNGCGRLLAVTRTDSGLRGIQIFAVLIEEALLFRCQRHRDSLRLWCLARAALEIGVCCRYWWRPSLGRKHANHPANNRG